MQPNQNILAIISEQPVFANKDYRFMKYCIMKDYPEGKLIFNGLTRTAVLLSPDEINEIGNINKFPFLYPQISLQHTACRKTKENSRNSHAATDYSSLPTPNS